MFPIYAQLDAKICKHHLDIKQTANVFGFIAYTETNPNIVKVLRDEDYWNSFNKLSDGWIVYAIKPPKIGSYVSPDLPEGAMGMMIPLWKEPEANVEFIKTFGLEDTSILPCFIAFAINEKGGFDQIIYRLDDVTVDAAYQSISKIIKVITKTSQVILPEYKTSPGVFREVKKQIECIRFYENCAHIGNFLKLLIEIVK